MGRHRHPEIIQTRKRADALWWRDYKYIAYGQWNRKRYWRCGNAYKQGVRCEALIHTTRKRKAIVEVRRPHSANCHPDKIGKKVARAMERCKIMAAESQENPNSIVFRVDERLSTRVAMRFPRHSYVRRVVRRERRRSQGLTKLNPKTIQEIFCPMELTRHTTKRLQSMLLYDSGPTDPERMMIWGTRRSLNLLVSSDIWQCDGTFRACSTLFAQLYGLHCRVGNRVVKHPKDDSLLAYRCTFKYCNQVQTYPAVFALLCRKDRRTYERLLRQLVILRPALANHCFSLLIDFEAAVQQAFQAVFADVKVFFCLFHLMQNVWRKVQKLCLSSAYSLDKELSVHIRMLPALCFVPPTLIVEAYSDVIRDRRFQAVLRRYPTMREFTKYMERYYIGVVRNRSLLVPPVYPVDEWSCHERVLEGVPRTNNSVEGFHSMLNRDVQQSNPDFAKMVVLLKRNVIALEHERLRSEFQNYEPTVSRTIYRWQNERIRYVVGRYRQYRTNYAYVRQMCNCFKLVP